VHDDPASVAHNRALVDEWLGARVAYATQVHGAAVAEVVAPLPDGPVGEVDALITTDPRIGLGVLVADCVPVLLADPVARVVGVAHAGRAGLVAGVVQAAVAAMVARGATTATMVAAVGPAIAGRSYEVPASLRDTVDEAVPGTATTTSWGTPGLDVPRGVLLVLEKLGVQRVKGVDKDTYRDETLFSHRRDGPLTGRFAGVIRMEPPGVS
jgi:polyphenol oxidase